MEFEIENWDDIKDRYFKIMLTPQLAKQLKINLVFENDVWWIEIKKDKSKKKQGNGENTIRNKKKDGRWGRGYLRRKKKQENRNAE